MIWESQRLTDDHDLTQFDCGNDSLNRWLTEHARRANDHGIARTRVWVEPGSPVVRAYYAVCPTQVTRQEVGRSQAAYLLAKLALDDSLKGQGFGSQLLLDALELIVVAAETGGGKLIVVDAIDAIDGSAAGFYRRHDFTAIAGDPHRLVMKVATARTAIGLESLRVAGDAEVRLASATLTQADGSRVHMMVDGADLRRVAQRLEELAETAGPVNLADAILDALGQRPAD